MALERRDRAKSKPGFFQKPRLREQSLLETRFGEALERRDTVPTSMVKYSIKFIVKYGRKFVGGG